MCYNNRFVNSAAKTIPSDKTTENKNNLKETAAKTDKIDTDLAKNDETLDKDIVAIGDEKIEISLNTADLKTLSINDEQATTIKNLKDFHERVETANSEKTCLKSPLKNYKKVAISKENVKIQDKIEKNDSKDLCLKSVIKYKKKRNRNLKVNDKLQEEIDDFKYDLIDEDLNKNKSDIKISKRTSVLRGSEIYLESRKVTNNKLDLVITKESEVSTVGGFNEEILHGGILNVCKIKEDCIDLEGRKEEMILPKSNDANNNTKDIKDTLEDLDALDIKKSKENDQNLSLEVDCDVIESKSDTTNVKESLQSDKKKSVTVSKAIDGMDGMHTESFNTYFNHALNIVHGDNDKNNLSSEINNLNINNFNKISNEAIISENITENIIFNNIIIIVKENRNESSRHFLQEVQNVIKNNIRKEFLPSLKCHGVNQRGVIYSCGNNKSCLWLKEILRNFKVTDYRDTTDNKYTVQIKTNTMLDVKNVLNLLELYNVGLCCKEWVVTGEKFKDFLVFVADIDCDSFKYVCDSNFKLSIGVDEVEFCISFSS